MYIFTCTKNCEKENWYKHDETFNDISIISQKEYIIRKEGVKTDLKGNQMKLSVILKSI